MKASIKANKTPRNQTTMFNESLAPSMQKPLISTAKPKISPNQARVGLGLIWVSAALAGGVGVGLLIRDNNKAPIRVEAPAPVASSRVVVAAAVGIAQNTPAIRPVAAYTFPSLTVSPSIDITQGQAGFAYGTLLTDDFQGASGSDDLQPRFAGFGHPQGNIGTSPVH